MSHASRAVDALHDAAKSAYAPTREAGVALHNAYKQATTTTDVVKALAAMVDLVLAAERLKDLAESAEKAARAAAAEWMEATGATTIQSAHHSAHLSRRPAYVVISDEAAIPGDYLVTKTSIDKSAIKTAIGDGIEVPGASLIRPNEQTIVIKARKDAAA